MTNNNRAGDELKACPIDRFIDVGRNQHGEIVYQGRITDSEREEIIAAWNTRTSPTPPSAQDEREALSCPDDVYESAVKAYAKANENGHCPDHCVAMACETVWQAARAAYRALITAQPLHTQKQGEQDMNVSPTVARAINPKITNQNSKTGDV